MLTVLLVDLADKMASIAERLAGAEDLGETRGRLLRRASKLATRIAAVKRRLQDHVQFDKAVLEKQVKASSPGPPVCTSFADSELLAVAGSCEAHSCFELRSTPAL